MYQKTRSQLTDKDYEFIADTLGNSATGRSSILHLADDPASATELLHNKELFERSMTTPPMFLTISPHLFFYIFVYQALDHRHIADDDVVDYVAGICVEFRTNASLWHPAGEKSKTIYFVDLLNLMNDVDKHQQYILRRYIGNASLFLTGFFPDFIFQRSKQKGAPPIEYYEQIGRSQFETAAGDSPAYDADAGPILFLLAERFVAIRSAINIYTDTYLKLHSGKRGLDAIERQMNTLDDQGFRDAIDLNS